MTESRIIRYGDQSLRTFALREDPSILINAAPLRHLKTFVQTGIAQNVAYYWQTNENIEVEKLFVMFPVGTDPSGKVTFSILNRPNESPEFEIEFNMNKNIAENAYSVNLSDFPPIKINKYGKLVSTVNAVSAVIVVHYCHIYESSTPVLIE